MPPRSPRRRPSALTHGLTSRQARDEACEEVEAMARPLLASSPHEPQLLEAARAAAEAIIHERRIRSYRRRLLEGHARHPILHPPAGGLQIPQLPPERFENPAAAAELYLTWRISAALDPLGDGTPNQARDGEVALMGALANRHAELARLATYERRAQSRRREALRVLDYLRIEAERRAQQPTRLPPRSMAAA